VTRILAATALFALVALGGSTAHAMSCQNRLVVVGDVPARVRGLCGDPADRVERVVYRTNAVQVRGPGGVVYTDVITVGVFVQQWVYDFGPQRFMRELVFEDGRLSRINTLGYGTPSGRHAAIDARPRPKLVARLT
jgi:hypothetical protein